MSNSRAAGRPRGSSRAMLEEAAAELFLEQTYAKTTVADITSRAGVSRNTFFNYFQAKSDLLWVDVDAGLAALPQALADCDRAAPVTDSVRRALLRVAAGFGPGRVPWALTQHDLMATESELAASALARILVQVGLVHEFVGARPGSLSDVDLAGRAFSTAVVAAAAAAVREWAGAGVARGSLPPYVDAAISPVCAGFGPVLAG
ncbi:TetR/AcrR family transcriptional regulator [Cryobacterium sp.]|jgi:AcrR family transcriptional regulator|uniref:TetR/AcrR family transcriptional regulator n=1 Tax=Cryobacterium sp. TaxID=1926290 RepID=UPI00260B85A4|nr:TetR/AcrR family transcriptional regulator [Cryobacterium sp.]MCU1447753.1 TetR family transcriptional regulator [Cryobacterium sp.]